MMSHYPTSDNIHPVRVILTFLILKKKKNLLSTCYVHERGGLL